MSTKNVISTLSMIAAAVADLSKDKKDESKDDVALSMRDTIAHQIRYKLPFGLLVHRDAILLSMNFYTKIIKDPKELEWCFFGSKLEYALEKAFQIPSTLYSNMEEIYISDTMLCYQLRDKSRRIKILFSGIKEIDLFEQCRVVNECPSLFDDCKNIQCYY